MAGDFDIGDLEFLNFDKEASSDQKDSTLSQIFNIPTQRLVSDPKICHESNAKFATPVTERDLKIQQEQRIPKKTRQANNWTQALWKSWASYRNSRPETTLENHGQLIPMEISEMDNNQINYWMQRFIVEIRRKDGSEYPPNTLTQIVAGLQRHLRNSVGGSRQFNFFKDEDTDFAEFRKTLDARMKQLTSAGVGVQKKRCDPVTLDDEVKMWETGVFSVSTASGLSNAVFFYNGKAFAFRGMEQHRQCVAEQFGIGYDHSNERKYVKYTPRVTKNVQGGLKHRRIEIAPVFHYEDSTNPSCLVRLYETYLSLIPRIGPLYRKPLENVSSYGPRFSANAIPVNQMSQMFKRFYAEAGIDTTGRNISNHSGRVTCCTTLYNEGFSDKAVISRSAHRSDAVRTYQREQFKILSDISSKLNAPPPNPQNVNDNATASSPLTGDSPGNERKCEVSDKLESKENGKCDVLRITLPDNVNKIVLIKGSKKIEMEI